MTDSESVTNRFRIKFYIQHKWLDNQHKYYSESIDRIWSKLGLGDGFCEWSAIFWPMTHPESVTKRFRIKFYIQHNWLDNQRKYYAESIHRIWSQWGLGDGFWGWSAIFWLMTHSESVTNGFRIKFYIQHNWLDNQHKYYGESIHWIWSKWGLGDGFWGWSAIFWPMSYPESVTKRFRIKFYIQHKWLDK